MEQTSDSTEQASTFAVSAIQSMEAAIYRPSESINQFVQRAGQALYRAKRNGRNRVVSEIDKNSPLSLTG